MTLPIKFYSLNAASLSCALAACILMTQLGWANTPPAKTSRSRAIETYSATEDLGAAVLPGNPQPPQALEAVKAERAHPPTTFSRAISPYVAAPPSTSKEGFDTVPLDQTEPLLTRLGLVEEIVRRHGRAYDYRVHTVRELQQILARLNDTDETPVSRRAAKRVVRRAPPRPRKKVMPEPSQEFQDVPDSPHTSEDDFPPVPTPDGAS